MNDGLMSVLDENSDRLLRYFRAHGAGEAAEDLLQELRVKVMTTPTGPLGAPVSYLFRAATNLVIDRRRAETQSRKRDDAWTDLADLQEGRSSQAPSPERVIDSRRTLALVEEGLAELTPRARTILRRHRVEGETQRRIAAELGISQSTVESDLREAYRLLHRIRERLDEE
ncbi:RNA polymerase sigma factor [Sphingomonas rhizophila]|nr:sigma-70 family RNA polymerase sigma factor [Sphingomonas rhizophila]